MTVPVTSMRDTLVALVKRVMLEFPKVSVEFHKPEECDPVVTLDGWVTITVTDITLTHSSILGETRETVEGFLVEEVGVTPGCMDYPDSADVITTAEVRGVLEAVSVAYTRVFDHVVTQAVNAAMWEMRGLTDY